MKPGEIRYRLISTFLQADGPMAIGEVVAECGIPRKAILPVLRQLVAEGLLVEGRLAADKPAPQYCWAARWAKRTQRGAATSKQKLQTAVGPAEITRDSNLEIDSDPVLAFNDFVLQEYKPPKDKQLLVFFQCSVRRPFSTSPSHGSMRRAVAVATGYWPRKQFESCPVHVVVLASRIGPVPYELEDVYPANIGGGGVKHFGPEHYDRVRPILAERMAAYITAHRDSYDHIATFTSGRYGEVMADARAIAGVDFHVFPMPDGPRVIDMGGSRPRTYWQKFWIQLYQEIVSWLAPAQRKQAHARLKKLNVEFR